jgi:hypothetical protein
VHLTLRSDEDIIARGFTRITMADGTAYQITMAGGDSFIVNCIPHAKDLPYVYTAVDLNDAIDNTALDRVKTIVESGVDINAQSMNGPVILTAMCADGWSDIFTAMDSACGKTVAPGSRRAVWDWLVRRPGIDWHSNANGGATLLMSVLTVDLQLAKDLPWAGINVHHQNTEGDTVLHLYLRQVATEESPGMQENTAMDCVMLLLQHGSGTLALTVNHSGTRPRDMWNHTTVGQELLRVGQETMRTVRSFVHHCIAVRDLATIVTDYVFGTVL